MLLPLSAAMQSVGLRDVGGGRNLRPGGNLGDGFGVARLALGARRGDLVRRQVGKADEDGEGSSLSQASM